MLDNRESRFVSLSWSSAKQQTPRHALQSSTQLTRGTCDNIGGYFVTAVDASDGNTTTDRCYYDTYNCPRYSYSGQCYSNRSSEMSCPTCNNIGGTFSASYDCYYYYYSINYCRYFSVGQQCHTDRCCKHVVTVVVVVTVRNYLERMPNMAVFVSVAYVCLSVRVSSRISQKLHVQTSRSFLFMLFVAIVRSSSDDNAIRYVLPVLWMFAPTADLSQCERAFARPHEPQASRPIGDANASDYQWRLRVAAAASVASQQ